MWPVNKVAIHFAKISLVDCKWSNLNAPGSYTPWSHSLLEYKVGLSISLYAGKGKCCIWRVNKVEIHLAKIGFVECKWSNLNAPGSYTPWSHLLLGCKLEYPFHSMQEKGNVAFGVLIKWKFILQKKVLWNANGPI